jgi:hypothetical protein
VTLHIQLFWLVCSISSRSSSISISSRSSISSSRLTLARTHTTTYADSHQNEGKRRQDDQYHQFVYIVAIKDATECLHHSLLVWSWWQSCGVGQGCKGRSCCPLASLIVSVENNTTAQKRYKNSAKEYRKTRPSHILALGCPVCTGHTARVAAARVAAAAHKTVIHLKSQKSHPCTKEFSPSIFFVISVSPLIRILKRAPVFSTKKQH